MLDILDLIIGKAYAQNLIPCPDGTMADPDVGCTNVPEALINSQSSIAEVLLRIAGGLLSFIVGFAIISLIYGGMRYSMATGSKKEIEKAKNIIFWSIFGLIVAILAKYVTGFVLGIIT